MKERPLKLRRRGHEKRRKKCRAEHRELKKKKGDPITSSARLKLKEKSSSRNRKKKQLQKRKASAERGKRKKLP